MTVNPNLALHMQSHCDVSLRILTSAVWDVSQTAGGKIGGFARLLHVEPEDHRFPPIRKSCDMLSQALPSFITSSC